MTIKPVYVVIGGVAIGALIWRARAQAAPVTDAGGAGDDGAQVDVPGLPKKIEPACFSRAKLKTIQIYPDLAHGGAYLEGRTPPEEARAGGVDLAQLRAVATIDGGRIWQWTWGPSWGGLSPHAAKVYARLRPGNASYGSSMRTWDGSPAVVRDLAKARRGSGLRAPDYRLVAGSFARGSSTMLDLYSRGIPRLDLPTGDAPVMDNYQRRSRYEVEGIAPREEVGDALDLWRVGQRVRDARGRVSVKGYECGGLLWVPGARTANWNRVKSRRSHVEFLYSARGKIAISRSSAGIVILSPDSRQIQPEIAGDNVPWLARLEGAKVSSRRERPTAWWGDSRNGMTMRAWLSIPWVRPDGSISR